MKVVSLDGQNWRLTQPKRDIDIAATVPGCVHTDLLDSAVIEDPYYRDNETSVQWISTLEWVYSRSFTVTSAMLDEAHLWLECDGLDTVATVRINGTTVGTTDNMFRRWTFDVRCHVREGENALSVSFSPAAQYINEQSQSRPLPAWGVGAHKSDSGSWIRKEPCNFGWDWGPTLTTSGIWRSLRLVAWSGERISDMRIRQEHVKGAVHLHIEATTEGKRSTSSSAVASVAIDGTVLSAIDLTYRGKKATGAIVIRNPMLWWPNNMGAQPLYTVTIELIDTRQNHSVAVAQRRIGLRTLELVREKDQWGESFYFAANGIPFFAKGANWIPADSFATRVTPRDYERLIGDAAAANMNMLRVWGGGIYEADAFYDKCDELGICIWQDFMFACSTYPAFDEAFMANVKVEAEENVARLRHHPCIALWCGNNELEQGLVGDEWNERQMSWSDYKKLFDQLLPAVVKKQDPDRPYWPCSPHSPCGDRADHSNPKWGDAHLWAVWHGRQPFEWYRTCEHRFNSEFGFQSFPEPKTVHGYTRAEDRNVTSPIMEHHQRSGIGNQTIMHYMLDWFRLPHSFDNLLWLSQILQSLAMKYAVEHWRRSMPRGMGTLYWQLNDCWPVASWASIDSTGRWKALHYAARHFYSPVLLSAVEHTEQRTVDLHITSDLESRLSGELSWTLTDLNGEVLDEGRSAVTLAPRSSRKVKTVRLNRAMGERSPEEILFWMELLHEGEAVSSNLSLFARPKAMPLPEPDINMTVSNEDERTFSVQIETSRPALWTWLELRKSDAVYSDNFVHIRPGKPVVIEVTPLTPMSLEAFTEELTARSLVDTY